MTLAQLTEAQGWWIVAELGILAIVAVVRVLAGYRRP